eukprot:SAG22_NODE_1007_length_6056_cov_7.409938_5_plen_574_part_00
MEEDEVKALKKEIKDHTAKLEKMKKMQMEAELRQRAGGSSGDIADDSTSKVAPPGSPPSTPMSTPTKLQVGEAQVGDVVRLSPDAKKSPIKMRDRDLFVRAVSKNGDKITYSPKKTGGKKEDQSVTTPDRLLLVKKVSPKKKEVTPKKKKEFVPNPIHLEMKDEFGILENDIIFTLEPTYDYMSAMMGSDVKEFFDPCPGDWRHGKGWDGLKNDWKSPAYCNPPFSKAFDWFEKAVEQAEKGVETLRVAVIPGGGSDARHAVARAGRALRGPRLLPRGAAAPVDARARGVARGGRGLGRGAAGLVAAGARAAAGGERVLPQPARPRGSAGQARVRLDLCAVRQPVEDDGPHAAARARPGAREDLRRGGPVRRDPSLPRPHPGQGAGGAGHPVAHRQQLRPIHVAAPDHGVAGARRRRRGQRCRPDPERLAPREPPLHPSPSPPPARLSAPWLPIIASCSRSPWLLSFRSPQHAGFPDATDASLAATIAQSRGTPGLADAAPLSRTSGCLGNFPEFQGLDLAVCEVKAGGAILLSGLVAHAAGPNLSAATRRCGLQTSQPTNRPIRDHPLSKFC